MMNVQWSIRLLIAIAVIAVSACESATGPEVAVPHSGEVDLHVGGDRFVWNRDKGIIFTDIPYSFENPFEDTLTFVSCDCGARYGLERWNGESWDRVDLGMFQFHCVLVRPMQVPPHAVQADTARVVGLLDDGSDPGHGLRPEELSGLYRLVLAGLHFDSGDWGDEVPHENRVSNPFWLALE